jgi:hypothetical protein
VAGGASAAAKARRIDENTEIDAFERGPYNLQWLMRVYEEAVLGGEFLEKWCTQMELNHQPSDP